MRTVFQKKTTGKNSQSPAKNHERSKLILLNPEILRSGLKQKKPVLYQNKLLL